jgi:hypothetical protein
MQDVNVSDDLRQLSLCQVKALKYDCYDINEYCFRTMKLEVSRPFAATTNSGAVANGEDANRLAADYYGVLKNIFEYMFNGVKELKDVFLNVNGLIQSTTPEWIILVWWR